MEFIDENLENYAQRNSEPESALLSRLNRETHQKIIMPRMLSGHIQGRLLSQLSHMIRPDYIVEVGTYTGYSALCLAEGLTENGKLVTMDINEELEDFCNKYFQESGYGERIDMRIGNALDIIPSLEDGVDLAFIDADKENYSHYFDQLLPKMRKGGVIIADNVLWSGKVLDPMDQMDEETKALLEFSKKVTADERVENLLLPVRDGLQLIRVR